MFGTPQSLFVSYVEPSFQITIDSNCADISPKYTVFLSI